jgi:hypothetical protein
MFYGTTETKQITGAYRMGWVRDFQNMDGYYLNDLFRFEELVLK